MGIALSALLLGEQPQWFHFAGVTLILTGVALSTGRLKIPRFKGKESMR
jgi:drug/metabolite transporter (DMT)-like permease